MKVWKVIFLVFLVIASVLIIANEPPYHNDKGVIFGTYYNISYNSYLFHTKLYASNIK